MYLDYAATTPLSLEMRLYIMSLLDEYGNPSSVHGLGVRAREIIENARERVAKFINCKKNEIIFTSGGAASNSLAIKGYTSINDCTVLYSPLCHSSILECIKSHRNSFPLKVDKDGVMDLSDLREWLSIVGGRALVVFPYADSEIGTIQDVKSIIQMTHFYNGRVFLDCTGSIPHVPVDVKALDIDMLSFSGHKLGALKGTGVLFKKKNIELEPLVYGTQEDGLFAGTENIIGIASLGKALKDFQYDNENCLYSQRYVLDYISKNISDAYLIGRNSYRLPNNIYMCFKGISGESLMILLDEYDFQVSTGSACSSGKAVPSPSLVAIGVVPDDIHSCIRISFCGGETEEELLCFCDTLKMCVERLRLFS